MRIRCATCKPVIAHAVDREIQEKNKPYPENQKERDNLRVDGRVMLLKAELKETRRDNVY